ncbi:hypothetical protein AAIB33_15495 [Microbacterium sp. AZCO]|uniref:hypothetical protein n=1 Tax=Microbacterium sp. AZCO TaxID=3142976 RepID=UPI0031F37A92
MQHPRRSKTAVLGVKTAAVGLVAVLLVALAGCTQSSSGSRATLYDGIDALAADSSAIVIGTVTAQHTEDDATVSTVEVDNAPSNPQLAAHLDDPGTPVAVGDAIDVREIGDPLLTVGEEYLLFVTPTMLTGPAASDYYVTGAHAGVYIRDGEVMRRVVTDTGDDLPETISIAGGTEE